MEKLKRVVIGSIGILLSLWLMAFGVVRLVENLNG
jgi:uncharacterized membrane protein